MKALARNHVWWSGIDKELEALVKSCPDCAVVKQMSAKAPLHLWSWPTKLWERIHLDFTGPFMGKSFLIIVDAYSMWSEVIEMSSTTAAKTITILRQVFSSYGLPEQIVLDNDPQFSSSEFSEFAKLNGIKHILISPYHLSSNGEAEKFVHTFKEAMKAGQKDGITLSHRLACFFHTYRTTPHSTTGVSPSELMMGRQLWTRWDLLKPDTGKSVCQRQEKQIEQHNCHAQFRSFDIAQSVMVKNQGSGSSSAT